MDNQSLKHLYDEMHKQGPDAWFDDGLLEREAIMEIGQDWRGLRVLEIGCGEGDLGIEILKWTDDYLGVDYSDEAVAKAQRNLSPHYAVVANYKKFNTKRPFDRIVMQGVIEHLDDPWTELDDIIDRLLKPKGDIVLSCPCFENLRGAIWMTLSMVGAVMSKTDKHFISQHDFEAYCDKRPYESLSVTVDMDWASGDKMLKDLRQRIPLALKDGNLEQKDQRYFEWLGNMTSKKLRGEGAVQVWKISTSLEVSRKWKRKGF